MELFSKHMISLYVQHLQIVITSKIISLLSYFKHTRWPISHHVIPLVLYKLVFSLIALRTQFVNIVRRQTDSSRVMLHHLILVTHEEVDSSHDDHQLGSNDDE